VPDVQIRKKCARSKCLPSRDLQGFCRGLLGTGDDFSQRPHVSAFCCFLLYPKTNYLKNRVFWFRGSGVGDAALGVPKNPNPRLSLPPPFIKGAFFIRQKVNPYFLPEGITKKSRGDPDDFLWKRRRMRKARRHCGQTCRRQADPQSGFPAVPAKKYPALPNIKSPLYERGWQAKPDGGLCFSGRTSPSPRV
jgi:hypothetical protein